MAGINGAFILHSFLAIVFLISGLLINLIQAFIYILFYHVNRNLYRRINYYLIYTSWSQIVAVAEWWAGLTCNLYGDEDSLKWFGKEHSIAVTNHKYDIDWLICWFVCDKLGMLGNAKTCAKKSLKRVPVIGWGWVFDEMVFLERNWEKDRLTLGPNLDKLVSYENPMMLLLFCEGTRFTPEKHEASLKFAKANNLPQLKHHLLPRAKGFNFAVAHLKNKIDAIVDVQIAFPKDSIKPTFSNILHGHKLACDMYVRRILINSIPTETEEETTKWLYNLYQEKDQVMEEYFKTNKFPGKCVKLERTPYSLANCLFWLVAIGLPFLYIIFIMLTTGNPWITAATVTVIILLLTGVHMMIGVTKADKGSTYGKVATSTNSAENGIIEKKTHQNCIKKDETSEGDSSSTKNNVEHLSNESTNPTETSEQSSNTS